MPSSSPTSSPSVRLSLSHTSALRENPKALFTRPPSRAQPSAPAVRRLFGVHGPHAFLTDQPYVPSPAGRRPGWPPDNRVWLSVGSSHSPEISPETSCRRSSAPSSDCQREKRRLSFPSSPLHLVISAGFAAAQRGPPGATGTGLGEGLPISALRSAAVAGLKLTSEG
ncbi:unnamed protein product [Prunus armeniaca]|uniref:Uncharacterized protein n=1 Tax=Prunus armeniaca TaxID=36596 RepID=A0A6J5VIM7_PRUAR|nr:unnamed protein product [Prunus armeniaca]